MPSYAIPLDDVGMESAAVPDAATRDPDAISAPMPGERPVLDPSVPFDVRSTEGERLTVRSDGREAAAFRPIPRCYKGHASYYSAAGADDVGGPTGSRCARRPR